MSQRFRSPARAMRRGATAVAGLSVAALALTGCLNLGPAPVSGYQNVQNATGVVEAQGTFVAPGTLDPIEYPWHGTGFFITPDGKMVTNNHVVAGAGTLSVIVGGTGGTEYSATVLGRSECVDLAVIQVNGISNAPFFAWHEGDINPGLPVWSAGYPGDFTEGDQYTLTSGSVNKAQTNAEHQLASLDFELEHNAIIRGGNSGGPLIDEQGRVVGVNYAGVSGVTDSTGGVDIFNYAIGRDQAVPLIPRLIAGEFVGGIGINANAWVAPDGSFGGVWAQSVVGGSAADAIGVEAGDLIYKLAGVSMGLGGTMETYCDVIASQTEAGVMDIQVYRPSTDQLLDGQINGRQLEVTAENVFGGGGGSGDGGGATSGFTLVTDSSGVVQVSVPAEWADVNGNPFTGPDGDSWPGITASPDIDGFVNSWDVPGVQVMATTGAVDLASIEAYFSGDTDVCQPITQSAEYNDGYYAGQFSQYWCGSSFSTLVEIIAAQSPAGGHSIGVMMLLPTEFDQSTARDEILRTFWASGLPE